MAEEAKTAEKSPNMPDAAAEEVKTADDSAKKPDAAAAADADNPLKTKRFESEHTMGEGAGASSKYKVVADWITLRKINKAVAEMFHTAYFLQPGDASRPITFVFNGGPGAASAYTHMGALGPRRVELGSNGEMPPPPAKVVDNDETWLGFTDLVFIDPIGTGFSRSLDQSKKAKEDEEGKGPKENPEFWDIDRDLESLGEFVRRFLSTHKRWGSPVFIAGESYGGYRVAKLARRLQDGNGVGLSGAILISPAIEVDGLFGNDYDITYWLETLPAYAATALHHKKGKHGDDDDDDLDAVLKDAEAFARDDLSRWLATGGVGLDPAEVDRIAKRMSDLIGIDAEFLKRANGRVDSATFSRELLRDEFKVVGRYDASLTGVDPYPDRPTYQGPDPTLAAIDRYYTGAIHQHLYDTLGVESDLDYVLLNMDVNMKWTDKQRKHVFQKTQGAMDDLRYGLSLNEHMKVFVCHGYYDLVTPYYHSERLLGLMKLTEDQKERQLRTNHYKGGHMFYSWDASRKAFRDDIKKLYADATGSVE